MARRDEILRFRDAYSGGMPTSVTATAAEINTLDGVAATLTYGELNILDGVTATAAEINKLDGFSPLSFINTGAAVTAMSDNYTLVLADANTCINAGTISGKTLTIPANASVAFPVGTIVVVAKSTNALTLAITTDTLLGSTTVAASTGALLIKVASTTWVSITSS